MYNRKYILILSIILLFAILPFVSAETYKQGVDIDLKVPCENLNCSSTNNITIVYPNSSIATDNLQMTVASGYAQYSFSLNDVSGDYRYFIYDLDDGSYSGSFSVTPNGENATEGKAIFYVGLLAVLLFFLAFSILGFVSFDNLLARVGLFGLSYLLLIAVTFIGWNMASDFLTSSPFLISMLRIAFFVLIVGVFPLVIGGFAYYIHMLFKIQEIERLMTKGFSYEDAERRTGRKFK